MSSAVATDTPAKALRRTSLHLTSMKLSQVEPVGMKADTTEISTTVHNAARDWQ
jgi:hypothetical protein